jgi:hypothetical protein
MPRIKPKTRYTTDEAAELLDRPSATLRKWRSDGRGPSYEQASEKSAVRYLGQWLIDFAEANKPKRIDPKPNAVKIRLERCTK